ncbi:unnamed protein product [Arctia plantaginis]|uniref:Alpha-tubulin N-acetyltransferase n=1 Tax=Arctia plantaginis TaxID=874455 RepID=A0A8S0Z2M8_ARCPL|nr:unnamed protein product [Arctia plantaginis]
MMELTVNEILHDEITKLDYTLIPPGYHGDVRSMRLMQDNLNKLINEIGEQSAAAQGLNRVITTAEKMRNSPDNTLFLLKDSLTNQGHGALIGLLKVGYKKLYLFDPRNKVREVEPLCVLDFFITQDHQRIGYGRVLFDYMLQALEVHPYELAIDGPSTKMEQFLAKNYGIDNLLRQNNNFAVAAQFFDNVVDISNKSGRSTPAIVAAVGRFAAAKPPSAIANVIHGGTPYYNDSNNGYVRARRAMNTH